MLPTLIMLFLSFLLYWLVGPELGSEILTALDFYAAGDGFIRL